MVMERISSKRLGKMRARDEGLGGSAGAVLNLTLIDGAFPQSAYALPVKVGSNTFPLEVDIGSADTWLASTSCSTGPCNAARNRYDASSATPMGETFKLNYLRGSVSGPIVTDQISVGPYTVPKQAFSAVDQVIDEPLTPSFVGLLGLALPSDSIIANSVGKSAGQTTAQNLLFPSGSASPANKFISLTLERPGSDTVSSLLGIGAHPSNLIKDASRIKYSQLIGGTGSKFWNVGLSGMSVFTNGEEHRMNVVGDVATLDSGIPVILTTTAQANAIYGTIGVGPAADGNYYMDCSTPLNITVTIGNTAVPIHPLDLSIQTSDFTHCQGLIQANDRLFTDDSSIGSFVLGVPFMRNIYTVMAYTPPNADGSFPPTTSTVGGSIDPRLGFLPLTDPAVAAKEFHTVRVDHRSLGGSHPATVPSNSSGEITTGIKIAIVAGAIVVACAMVFVVRFFWVRRRYRQSQRLRELEERGAEAEKNRADFARLHRDSGAGGYALATFSGDTIRGSMAGDLRAMPVGAPFSPGKEGQDVIRGSYYSATQTLVGTHSQSDSISRGYKVGEFGDIERHAANEVVLPTLPRVDEQSHARRPSDTPLLQSGPRFPGSNGNSTSPRPVRSYGQ